MTPPEELTTVLPSRGERVGRRLHPATVLLAALSAWLAVEAVLSVWWGMELDTPDLSYLAFMIDRLGRIPYAQTFDPSAPGSLLFHLGIGKTVGYSEIAFGIVNLAWLSALLFLTRRLMRPFGPRIAWAASVLVGLGYLQHGRDMSLQRDYIALVPIVAACVVAERSGRGRSIRRAAAIGLLFGLAATIKPQLALGLPVVVLFFVTGGGDCLPRLRGVEGPPARRGGAFRRGRVGFHGSRRGGPGLGRLPGRLAGLRRLLHEVPAAVLAS